MDISVITINYNSTSHSKAMVEALDPYIKGSHFKVEIIIVDNNSKLEQKKAFEDWDSPSYVKKVFNDKNTGFASGNMRGVQEATGEYYFFFNNDCLAEADLLTIFHSALEKNEKWGIVSGQMYDSNMGYQHSYHYDPTLLGKILGLKFGLILQGRSYRSPKVKIESPLEVDVISGACIFINSRVFNDLGGLDTNFFLYCEEEDLCLRVRKSGLKVVSLPNADYIHDGGGSTNRNLEIEKIYYDSFFYYLKKHRMRYESILWKSYLYIKYKFLSKSDDRSQIADFIISK